MSELTHEEPKAKPTKLETKQQHSGIVALVSDKGGVSVYGIDSFSITLYYEQWGRLLDTSQEIREFLEANKNKLKLNG